MKKNIITVIRLSYCFNTAFQIKKKKKKKKKKPSTIDPTKCLKFQ